jgi:transcriptional regulator of acetoin/glycerol metabolism
VVEGRISLDTALRQVEREALRAALELSRGNRSAAARVLGMPRQTFLSRLRRAGLIE